MSGRGRGIDYSELGAEIRRARCARGLSREELGVRLGNVHRDTIGAWERGERLPGPQNLRGLTRELGLEARRLQALMRPCSEESAAASGPLFVAGWPDVVAWGWSAVDLLAHLMALDEEVFAGLDLPAEARGTAEYWAPIYAELPECWRLVCDAPRHVVANWALLPLRDGAYARACSGGLLEAQLGFDDIDFMVLPGRYRLLVVDFLIRPAWTGAGVRVLLMRSLLDTLVDLAHLGVFVSEVCTNTHTSRGAAFCRALGMTKVADHRLRPGFETYVMPLLPLREGTIPARYGPLRELYARA